MKTMTMMLALAAGAWCQITSIPGSSGSGATVSTGTAAPTASCTAGALYLRTTTGVLYTCRATDTWVPGVVVTITTGSAGQTITAAEGFFVNDTAGAITYSLPTPSAGVRICVRNNTTRTGAITLDAATSTYIDADGANGTSGGTIVSGGALGDSACVLGVSATQWMFYKGSGTWANN